MSEVRAKKHLGQHFLTDKGIAGRIVDALNLNGLDAILEVGPGMGILSDHLLKVRPDAWLIDLDQESIAYLHQRYPESAERILSGDFLTLDFEMLFPGIVGLIGNFPYNISSQILFKVLEERHKVKGLVGMFQKEVAERCTAKPGSKIYGILSVFLQAFFKVEYLFTVKAGSFNPPPKVLSGVIRLSRNEVQALNCNEERFFKLVKAAFNQRRKTLRNALSGISEKARLSQHPLLELRAARLSVSEFVILTNELFPENDGK